MASVAGSFHGGIPGEHSDIMKRDKVVNVAAGADRALDLELPPDARVFMTGMAGTTNGAKARKLLLSDLLPLSA